MAAIFTGNRPLMFCYRTIVNMTVISNEMDLVLRSAFLDQRNSHESEIVSRLLIVRIVDVSQSFTTYGYGGLRGFGILIS